MSCPEFVNSPRGRAGIGVIQPQSGLDYPFVNPSADIRYLVADFYFVHDADVDYQPDAVEIQYPLHIKRLYNVGCNENPVPTDHVPRGGELVDVVLADAAGNVIFDTTTAELTEESTSAWGDDYVVYTWRTQKEMCRALLYTTWPTSDDDKRHYDKYLAPVSATLDARSIYREPKHVLSLRVRNGAVITGPYRNDVIFKNGYNTELAAGATTAVQFRRTTRISFTAVPGSGDGQYPCAENTLVDEYPIKTINGVGPRAAGHFLMGAADCLWIRRPTIYTPDNANPFPQVSAQQQIGADCKPCCSCTDYSATALYMNDTRDKYKLIGQRAADVKNLHETNIARWNAYRQCTIGNPLKLAIVPQRAPFIDVAVMACNNCDFCLPASNLQLAITVLSATATNDNSETEEVDIASIDASVVCGYTEVYFPGIAAKTTTINKPAVLTYTVPFPQLKPGDSGYVKFRLEFSVKAALEVRAVLTGTTAGGTPIPLNCGEVDIPGALPVPASVEFEADLNFQLAGRASRSC
jgi:hypothetical protein